MVDYSPPQPGMRVSIIGDGAWGTASAMLLHNKGYDVRVWGAFPEYTREIIRSRQNYKYLPGIPLPESLVFTNDLTETLRGSRLVVMALPSHVMREVARRVAAALPEPTPFLSLAKGLEADTLKRMSVVLREVTNLPQIAVLSGPSHAEEVARRLPTAVVAASEQLNLATFVQDVFSTPTFRVYTNTDVVGVELCATLKNVIAICAGAVDGFGYGDNAKSALLTRGLVEMVRFGTALGGKVETFFGLAGVGDLITTCFSRYSRNRGFGERVARGMSVADALAASTGVVEGYRNAPIIRALARKLNIEMPITEALCQVLYEGKDIRDAVAQLMTRERKSEHPTGHPLRRWVRLMLLRARVMLMMQSF
ncbi:MAG: NAD(P)-dependent glycerol-3-phosphate dehydrogenase [bacterium]|nr:NAD(P)-dependent glycerol-3-phosphate dehydrogenase [bacterium]